MVSTKDNFAFLKKSHAEIYEVIHSAESNVYIDYNACANKVRRAAELFCSEMESQYDIKLGKDLQERLGRINKYSRYYFRQDQVKFLMDAPDGSTQEVTSDNIIRVFGNSGSHAPNKEATNAAALDSNNAIEAMKAFHLIAGRAFTREKSMRYDVDAIPVGKYEVMYDVNDPRVLAEDTPNGCVREVMCCSFMDGSHETDKYALIRIYESGEADSVYLRRSIEAYHNAAHESPSAPAGIAVPDVLAKYEDRASDYYIIAYLFNQPPTPLSNTVLREMSKENKIAMCVMIAEAVAYLHNLENAVYLRMFSNHDVFVVKIKDRYVPMITRFNYAKIEGYKGTVVSYLMDAAQERENLAEAKYVPDELSENGNDGNMDDVDWEKVDIFSLGVLFADIICGTIGKQTFEITDVERAGYPDALVDLIDKMTSGLPLFRPSADEAAALLKSMR